GVGMLQELLERAPIGDELTLTIDRQGNRLELKVRPQAAPAPPGRARPLRLPGALPEPGRDPGQVQPRGTPSQDPDRPATGRPAPAQRHASPEPNSGQPTPTPPPPVEPPDPPRPASPR